MSNITGERISYLRCECNLTREELCKIIGVSKRTIVAYEQGTRDPSDKPLRLDAIRKEEKSYILLPKTIQESKARYNSINDYVNYIASKHGDK